MQEKTRGSKLAHGKGILFACALMLCSLLFITQAGGCLFESKSIHVGDLTVARDATELDARGANVTDVTPILELTSLMDLELRDNPVAAADYERIRTALPGCDVRWSVPISGIQCDSESQTLLLPAFTEADIAMLAYFPNLVSVDASGSTDYSALRHAISVWPDLTITWTVSVCGQTVERNIETLDLSSQTVDADELLAALPGLTGLKKVNLQGTGIGEDALTALRAARPDVEFTVNPELFGISYAVDTIEVDLSAMTDIDTDALIAGLESFPALERVNLRGCTLTDEQRAALMEAYPDVLFLWTVELIPGVAVDSEATEAVIPTENPDTETMLKNLAYLPELVKIDMTACYEPSEETNAFMETLMAARPDIKFVWYVRVGNWQLRTDITAFCMGNQDVYEGGFFVGGTIYPSANNETFKPIRYCTDLVALDIGHANRITELSSISGLTKLKYLVMSMMKVADLSPLANLPELEFLECFQNPITDLSPLLNCKKLKYINAGTTYISDTDALSQMTQLKRLWICNTRRLPSDLKQALKTQLPNTIICTWTNDWLSQQGWRTRNPAYLIMRDMFNLFYQDQDGRDIGDEEYHDWDIDAFEQE